MPFASDEEAKAVQETAKATGRAIELGQAAGSYFAKILGTLPEDFIGLMGGDAVHHWRLQNLMQLEQNTRRIAEERGFSDSPRQVPPKLLIPTLSQASLEDEETMQQTWARLLANASDPAKPELDLMFSDTIRLLSRPDAQLTDFFYSQVFTKRDTVNVLFDNPPADHKDFKLKPHAEQVRHVYVADFGGISAFELASGLLVSPTRLAFGIDKLARLSLLSISPTSNSEAVKVTSTVFGREFHASVS